MALLASACADGDAATSATASQLGTVQPSEGATAPASSGAEAAAQEAFPVTLAHAFGATTVEAPPSVSSRSASTTTTPFSSSA